ncbi:hypothetical protein BDR26DRAFT_628558 [Obelidium mucronatum]|nr:hypothetical protein BDR26DRAFT_628558 [Obelidium mucronatum]
MTNATETNTHPATDGPTTLSLIVVPLNAFLMGICFEACTSALLISGYRLYQILAAQTRKESPFMTLLIVIFNAGAMLSFIMSVVVFLPLTEHNCIGVDWFSNFIWHVYFVTFNIFVLYKSYIVTDRNTVYAVAASLAFLYRIAWTIPDLVWTGGIWDSEKQECNYHFSHLAGFHYTIADIICDVVATAGAVTMFLRPENRSLGFSSLWIQLVKENVIRSVVTLIVNPIVMYMNLAHLDSDTMTLVYMSQNYVYVRMLNLELYFKEARQATKVSTHLTSDPPSRASVGVTAAPLSQITISSKKN